MPTKFRNTNSAFTLMELLLVIAIIAVLVVLLLPTLSRAKNRAALASCINNLKQLNVGAHLYADDHNDLPPDNGIASYITYKELIKSYVGQKTSSSPNDRLFTCPRDRFHFDENSGNYVSSGHHEQLNYDYSSYAFNGLNRLTNFPAAKYGVVLPGIAGQRLASIKNPTKTVLIVESAALVPYSWHAPAAALTTTPAFTDAEDVDSFADGHAAKVKTYWDSSIVYPNGSFSAAGFYDPPDSYDYKWSGN